MWFFAEQEFQWLAVLFFLQTSLIHITTTVTKRELFLKKKKPKKKLFGAEVANTREWVRHFLILILLWFLLHPSKKSPEKVPKEFKKRSALFLSCTHKQFFSLSFHSDFKSKLFEFRLCAFIEVVRFSSTQYSRRMCFKIINSIY